MQAHGKLETKLLRHCDGGARIDLEHIYRRGREVRKMFRIRHIIALINTNLKCIIPLMWTNRWSIAHTNTHSTSTYSWRSVAISLGILWCIQIFRYFDQQFSRAKGECSAAFKMNSSNNIYINRQLCIDRYFHDSLIMKILKAVKCVGNMCGQGTLYILYCESHNCCYCYPFFAIRNISNTAPDTITV